MVAISKAIPRVRAAVKWEELWVYDSPIFKDIKVETLDANKNPVIDGEGKQAFDTIQVEVLPGHIWIAEVTQDELRKHLHSKSRWLADTNKWIRAGLVIAGLTMPMFMFSPLPFILVEQRLMVLGIIGFISIICATAGWFSSNAFMGKPMTVIRRTWDAATKEWVISGYVHSGSNKDESAKGLIELIGKKKAIELGMDENSRIVSSASTLNEMLEAKDERAVLQGPGDKTAKTLQFVALAIVALSVFGLFVLYALAQKGQA